jgi:hypothetical protein
MKNFNLSHHELHQLVFFINTIGIFLAKFIKNELFLDRKGQSSYIFRLRYILHQLNSGQLPLEDLKRNIEYAALVLETAYLDETRYKHTFFID